MRLIVEYWVINREWWRERESPPDRPEMEFWRVEASTGPGMPGGTYELRRDVAAGGWSLFGVSD